MSASDWQAVEASYAEEELRIHTRLRQLSKRDPPESEEELRKLQQQREQNRKKAQKRNLDLLKEKRNDNHLDIDHETNNERPKSPRDRAKPVVVSHSDHQGPPLDYSFKNIETIESLKTEKPRKGNKSYKKTKDGKYSCASLRLNNNYIENISGIHAICLEIIEAPEKLTWLDLSFNRLTSVPAEISTLSSLKIIYLHGNHLVDLPAVLRPLKMLDGLYSLTLHGNPIEERENYRYKIMAHLPHLKTLDFNKITLADRKKVESMRKKH